jgi:hypothetical protein
LTKEHAIAARDARKEKQRGKEKVEPRGVEILGENAHFLRTYDENRS